MQRHLMVVHLSVTSQVEPDNSRNVLLFLLPLRWNSLHTRRSYFIRMKIPSFCKIYNFLASLKTLAGAISF